ncbi:MAG TPA: hypothetical protein DCS63_04390 [Elusimicrobia bacterium]|nr:hypothetical protein [Elusimicrobiota bacterium]
MCDPRLDSAGAYLDQSDVILAKINPSEVDIDTQELFQIINPGIPAKTPLGLKYYMEGIRKGSRRS